MKTREQIYGREVKSILRDISMYRVLTKEQIMRLCQCKSDRDRDKIENLLKYMEKQNRIWYSEEGGCYCAAPDALEDMDRGLLAAVWVLADFIEQVEYHSVSDFPAKIVFFVDGEVYEVIHATQGKEALISCALSGPGAQYSCYLVLVDDPMQITELQIPNVRGYCTVSETGDVQYYQKE